MTQYPDADDILAWIDANGIMPLGPELAAQLSRIDALIGGVAVDLDAPLEPNNE